MKSTNLKSQFIFLDITILNIILALHRLLGGAAEVSLTIPLQSCGAQLNREGAVHSNLWWASGTLTGFSLESGAGLSAAAQPHSQERQQTNSQSLTFTDEESCSLFRHKIIPLSGKAFTAPAQSKQYIPIKCLLNEQMRKWVLFPLRIHTKTHLWFWSPILVFHSLLQLWKETAKATVKTGVSGGWRPGSRLTISLTSNGSNQQSSSSPSPEGCWWPRSSLSDLEHSWLFTWRAGQSPDPSPETLNRTRAAHASLGRDSNVLAGTQWKVPRDKL